MTVPNLRDDDDLLAALRRALHDEDVPAAAVDAALAAFDLGRLEGELAEVVHDSALQPLAGVRHDGSSPDRVLTLEFAGGTIDLDLPWGTQIVLGQIDPPGPDQVVIESADPSAAAGGERVAVDDLGRFRGHLRPGPFRLHLTNPGGPVATPWITQ